MPATMIMVLNNFSFLIFNFINELSYFYNNFFPDFNYIPFSTFLKGLVDTLPFRSTALE